MAKHKYVAMEAIHNAMILLKWIEDATMHTVPRQNLDSLAQELGYTDAEEVFDLVEAYEQAASGTITFIV